MRHVNTFGAFLRRILKRIFDGIISRLPPPLVSRSCEQLLRVASKNDRFFHMMDSLPKGSDPARYGLTDPVTPEPPGRIAVVIQGPVLGTDDFTLETVRLYRHVCPDMTVILSTWDNSPVEIIQRCREAGADVVLSRSGECQLSGNLGAGGNPTRRRTWRAVCR